MKKIILLALLVIHFTTVYSQAYIYHPMPVNNAIWRVDHNSTPCGGLYSSYQYEMGSDCILIK